MTPRIAVFPGSFDPFTAGHEAIVRRALALFDREWPEGGRRTVRLVGFGVTDFVETRDNSEPSLFPSPLAAAMDKRERLAEVLDRCDLHRVVL